VPLNRRTAESIIRPVGGVEEIQVVGGVSDTIFRQLDVRTEARSVWLHPDIAQHINEQRTAKKRQIETGDAEFSFQHLPRTILEPDYCGLDRRDKRRRRIDLVRAVEGTDRFLFVAIKVVSAVDASSNTDEIWVCTAHPLVGNFLTQKRYKHTLQPVSRMGA
jgi:hypothetical protein